MICIIQVINCSTLVVSIYSHVALAMYYVSDSTSALSGHGTGS